MAILVADIGGTAIKVGKIGHDGQLIEFQEFENDGKKTVCSVQLSAVKRL